MKNANSVLFLGKIHDECTQKALDYCRQKFASVSGHLGKWGDPLPTPAADWEGNYIVSYLSRWVVTEALLKRATTGAINFHPAPPEFPGVGCTNFALYQEAKEYG